MKILFLHSRFAGFPGVFLLTLFSVILGTGCVTEKKAKAWLDSHPVQASQYCAITFPVEVETEIRYRVDSVGYKEAVDSVVRFADSILDAARAAGKDTAFIEVVREKVRTEIKYKLRPCVDSVKEVIRTVENTARVRYLSGLLDGKDKTISDRDARIGVLEKRAAKRLNWLWILIAVCVGQGLWISRKLWMPLLGRIS